MSDTPAYTQAGRLLRIDTPLGEDVLLLESFDGKEEVSELFEFTAVVRSRRTDLKAEDLVGKLVDVSVALKHGEADGGANEEQRTWNALCVALHEGELVARGMRHYTLTLRPQLWLLTRRADCRIFLDKSSTGICQSMLAEHGLPAPDMSGLVGPSPPPPRPYSVQWNETDLAYLDRRLEQDGVFYWFEHKMGQHVMHLGNHQAAYQDLQPEARLRMARGSTDRNHINAFDRTFHFIPSQRAGRDWNFETPGREPDGQSSSNVRGQVQGGAGGAKYELYEYPGHFMDAGAGEGAMRNRMQAAETDHNQVTGQSRVRTLSPARRFTPYEVPHPDRTHPAHIATKVEHHADDPTYDTGAATKDGKPASPSYTNSFDATHATVPAIPHRDTAMPRIDGAQIAVVAGPPGEEIHTDKYGRVKLRFPWDRHAKGDGSDTVWVRVSQPSAGGTYGAQVIPRIGMEVLVTYQDGDPDRPLVTGMVPNPQNPVPYGLPENKTRTVFRSNTHKGQGFNEMSMEDQAGKEEFYLHAQKDMTHLVGDSLMRQVGNAHTQTAGTLHLSTVGESVLMQTLSYTLLRHASAILYLDANEVRLSFGGAHAMVMDANGIRIHSPALVQASQGGTNTAANWVAVTGSGVDVHGKQVHATAEAAAVLHGSTTNISGSGSSMTFAAGPILHQPSLVLGGGPQAVALVAAAIEGKPFCAVCAGMSGGG